ncbi:MAG: hypothetical protein JWR51_903 [Devosia sp.]|uniref:hypothetical protein n=1 Tax=Devosia sp. TaxID=1871048 RepID=UPI00262CF570|nr:hypothetical protein [Devosia sp.]MDB5527800.1 hypothetical protein [Devosia sp.]
MNTYLKSGFAAAVVGLGIFASAGSAFAAGCLTPDQTAQSLIDSSDADYDAAAAANVKGFRCDVVASDYSVQQPATKVTPKVYFQAAPEQATPTSLMD